MANWSKQMLAIFQEAETLVIMPREDDGQTIEEMSPLSPVVYNDGLYVRGWKGLNTKWFLAAKDQPVGSIELYGHRFPVTFKVPSNKESSFDEGLSDAFGAKFKNSDTAAPHALISDLGVQATLQILPRVPVKQPVAAN